MIDEERIKAEIEKRIEQLKKLRGNGVTETGRIFEACIDELTGLLSAIDSMLEDSKAKCRGCNNVKGCVTCVEGSEWAHYEECNITGIKSKFPTGKLKEYIEKAKAERKSKFDAAISDNPHKDNGL